jgi:hypothetical protein
MKRLSYPSDLTEKEWVILEPLIPQPSQVDIHAQRLCEK